MLPPFKVHNLHRKPHTAPYEPSRYRSVPWNFMTVLQVCCILNAPHVPNSMFRRQFASVSHKNWCVLATPTLQPFLQLRLSSVKTALFWPLIRQVVVIPYRRFRTTCRSHLHGSRIQFPFFFDSWSLTVGSASCPETSVRNYHHSLRKSPKERTFPLLRGGNLKSHNQFVVHLTTVYPLFSLRKCWTKWKNNSVQWTTSNLWRRINYQD